jgi:molybdenum cofactor cytidylyltransferase
LLLDDRARPRFAVSSSLARSYNFVEDHSMSRALSLCGLILAAGESSRMGSEKSLLPWPPVAPGQLSPGTFLSAAIRSLIPHTDMVLVVVGENEPNLAPIIYANGADLVRNPDPARGQFSSLRLGLHEVLNRGRDAAMLTLVDRPPVSSDTIGLLGERFETAAQRWKWAVVPEYRGKHGHPIVLGRELLEAFLRAPLASNAREVEHANQEHIEYVSVDDPLIAININTPEEYVALQQTMRTPQAADF